MTTSSKAPAAYFLAFWVSGHRLTRAVLGITATTGPCTVVSARLCVVLADALLPF